MLIGATPPNFTGKGSVEIEYEKRYQDMVLILRKELGQDTGEMNVLQFYTSFNFLKNKSK